MGDFNRVGGRTFVYWLVTRVLVSFLVALLIGVGLALLGYSVQASPLITSLQVTTGTAIAIAALSFVLLAGAALLMTLIQYQNLGFRIDEHSLFLRQGFIAVDTETIPLYKVVNTSFDQSAWQRLFGVGNLKVDQDDDHSVWSSIDKSTASRIMETVSTKGNIQPIDVGSGQFPPTNQPS